MIATSSLPSCSHLTRINLDNLVDSFGWTEHRLRASLLKLVFRWPARTFARQVLEFDRLVGEVGIARAARPMLAHYVRRISVYSELPLPIPPFLALANHPGLADALSIFLALDCPDLKIIGLPRPFLFALPHISQRIFYINPEPADRVVLIRRVASHLRNGGALLTFPAGRIEPDPDLFPDQALHSLNTWSDSAGLFLRLAPHTPILPILVRGVIWPPSLRHPPVRLKRTRYEQDKLAAALQLLTQLILRKNDLSIRVQLGRPICAADLGRTDTPTIHRAVLDELRRLLHAPLDALTPIYTFP